MRCVWHSGVEATTRRASSGPCQVLLDAGTASDLSAELLTAQARAVVVPDASMADDARTLMCDQLKAVGFTEVTMLSKPSEPLNALEPGPRVAAA